MQRVKNVQYDQEDLFEDVDVYDEEEQCYTAEDRKNFATLIPVVRAELEEGGLHASDREIEEALWHYYWDVGKSVSYLTTAKTPKRAKPEPTKVKPKSKFDEAAERMASSTGKWTISFLLECMVREVGTRDLCEDQEVGIPTRVQSSQLANAALSRFNGDIANVCGGMVSGRFMVVRPSRKARKSFPSQSLSTTTTAAGRIFKTRQTRRGAPQESCSLGRISRERKRVVERPGSFKPTKRSSEGK